MLIEENDYNYTIFMKELNNFMDDENKFVYRYKLSPEVFL